MTNRFSNKYPPKNRRENPHLSVVEIEIAWQGGSVRMDMNAAAMAGHRENLNLGEPSFASDITGAPGYEYRSDEVTLALTRDELYRLLRHDLRPAEFLALVQKYGTFYEVHDDFYDEGTGQALQPVPRAAVEAEAAAAPAADIEVATSTTGDWVRIARGNEVLLEGHSIGPAQVASLLEQLGFKVSMVEKDPDAF